MDLAPGAQSCGDGSPALDGVGRRRAATTVRRHRTRPLRGAIAGCNDCHTAGYAAAGGKVPESQWLTGDAPGWRGPWGTTYPANLRRCMHTISEAQWVQIARTAQYRPPMPWMSLHAMSDIDLRSVCRIVCHLGPAGEAAPAYVPPGARPQTPFVQFPAPPAPAGAPAASQ